MGRFMVIWVLISIAIGLYQYFFSRSMKREAKVVAKRTAVSMGIGLAVIFVLMQLNNFSGI